MVSKNTLLFGFLVWLIPFIVGFLTFPIRESDRPLFESIMAVTLVLSTVVFALRYFRRTNKASDGLTVGLVWLAISVVLDLVLLVGMFKIPVVDYMKDIALTYLLVPTITAGFGQLSSKK